MQLSRSPVVSKINLRGGDIGIHHFLVHVKNSLDDCPLLPAIRTIDLRRAYRSSLDVRGALRDFVERYSLYAGHCPGLQRLILPNHRDTASLLPFVETVRLKGKQGSPSPTDLL